MRTVEDLFSITVKAFGEFEKKVTVYFGRLLTRRPTSAS
jgi:hypothetical protein